MINGLQSGQGSYNELSFMLRNGGTLGGDPIGFNPTMNQAEYGTPQNSIWGALASLVKKTGLQLSNVPPGGRPVAQYPAGDYFPSYPFRGIRDYTGRQGYGAQPSEMLYARLRGYRGILPINQLPLINRPYPYQVPAVEQFGEA
jgi:hypothetical protein